MLPKISVLLLASVLVFGQSCSTFRKVFWMEPKLHIMDRLWEDVPQIDGSARAEMNISANVRLEVKFSGADEMDYVAYSTSRTTAEVESFYSKDRMAKAGWRSAAKCLGDSRRTSLSQGAVCIYYRSPVEKKNMLAIHTAEDPESKRTIVYYVRFEIADEEARSLAEAGERR